MAQRKTHSTNNINRKHLNNSCGLMYALDLLSGRWKLKILYKLADHTLRFSKLKEQIPNITDRMLTLHLKELEQDGLVERKVFAEVPPRVEYQLTASTHALVPIWKQLEDWGNTHRDFQLQQELSEQRN